MINILSLIVFWPIAVVQFCFCFLLHFFRFILRGFKFHLSFFTTQGDLFGLKLALMDSSRDINEKNGFGQTAFHGIFFDKNDPRNKPFLNCINNKEIIDFLIKNEADINALDYRKWSPLAYAISGDYIEEAMHLINSKGILINQKLYKNKTALHYAVRINNIQLAKALMEKGADTSALDSFHLTPIEFSRSQEMTDLLNSSLQKVS